ncbi:hypothetical protein J23TS9_18900 [Paenibacillus sp. J23TS9]|nr:hypothetical protein J23TS9_18900 [Paenibacillus sp. J23TS9]
MLLLPNDKHMTTSKVIDYFEVNVEVINMTVKGHRDELESDGIEV